MSEKYEKYIRHPIVRKRYENNKSFYVDVHTQNYDINHFARKVMRKRWCDLTIIKFLAFGVLGDDHEKAKIIKTLNTALTGTLIFFCLWYLGIT